ncbi:MAG: TGS domain-containing protein, partial [Phascolarctobacterium sp.]|nr:TGS domain-containing protein [Phascolarctobacterium sp.]
FEMHRISEYGIAAHWRYKESGGSKPASGTDKSFDAKLSWLRQLLEWHNDMNDSRDFVNTVKMDIFADEVFVFTPRGDVIDLPVGSVPIDFAYRIHTDVGNRCVGAKVNGRIVPLDYQLKNGDIVEVITSKQSNGPSRDWINIVGSSDTRNKIKNWFKKERREENILKGREMLEREVKRLGYEVKVLATPEKLKAVGNKLRIDTDENLLATLGYGGVTLNTVMSKLVELYKKEQKLETTKDLAQVLAELKPRKSKAKASHGILVKGEDGIMVKLARCCNPIPGDPVVGYITRGSGVSVHRADCPNVLSNNPEEQSRLIEVSWDVGIDDVYKVNIMITSQDRPGMMSDIMNVTSEAKLNIFSLSCHTDKNKMATTHMGLDITSLDQLEYVMNRIRRMKGVYTVERVFSTSGGGGKRK